MEQPEFTALQVTVFVRTRPGEAAAMQEFLNSVPFEAHMQETASQWLEQQLKEAGLSFEEIIIDLHTPATKAKATGEANKKSSPLARLFGKK
jgi:histidinol phosphatase-like enzyme